MPSSCCDSKLVYANGNNFKLDMRNKELNNLPYGSILFYECGKCKKKCDYILENIHPTNEPDFNDGWE
jgi:hypothetical protein